VLLRTSRWAPVVALTHPLKGDGDGRHAGSSTLISGRARSGWSARPGSRSRRWPATWESTRGTLGNWVNADKRRRGDGTGALDTD
jgi:hypothetical protein